MARTIADDMRSGCYCFYCCLCCKLVAATPVNERFGMNLFAKAAAAAPLLVFSVPQQWLALTRQALASLGSIFLALYRVFWREKEAREKSDTREGERKWAASLIVVVLASFKVLLFFFFFLYVGKWSTRTRNVCAIWRHYECDGNDYDQRKIKSSGQFCRLQNWLTL